MSRKEPTMVRELAVGPVRQRRRRAFVLAGELSLGYVSNVELRPVTTQPTGLIPGLCDNPNLVAPSFGAQCPPSSRLVSDAPDRV